MLRPIMTIINTDIYKYIVEYTYQIIRELINCYFILGFFKL